MKTFVFDHVVVMRIIDGDTLAVDIDLGNDCHWHTSVRLAEVYAPERFEPGGPEATAILSKACPVGTAIKLISIKREKFGRVLGEIYLADGTYLNGWLAKQFAPGGRGYKP